MAGTKEGVKKSWIKRKALKSGSIVLEKGQTLRQVSEIVGVPLNKLISHNKITSKNQIKSGLTLEIPK